MAKEAEMMCSWMHKNKKPIDFDDFPIPSKMWDCNDIRRHTLDFMVNRILKNYLAAENKTVKEEPADEHMTVKEEPARSGPGGDGDNIAADGAANTAGYGWSTCFLLDAALCGLCLLLLLGDKHCDNMPFVCIITRGSQSKKGGEKSNKNFGGKSNKRKRKEGKK